MFEQNKPKAQVSKLMRADTANVQTLDQWQAPDLVALKAKEAEQQFQRALAFAKEEIAQELALLRESDRKQAFEQGRQQGLTQGYEEGYALGLKEAQAIVNQEFSIKVSDWEKETSATREEWVHLFQQISQVFDVLDPELFDQVIWLSKGMAERMLRAELTLNPAHVQRIAREVLLELPKLVYPVSISVSPEDLSLLEQLHLDVDGQVTVAGDEQLKRGECRVISGHAEVLHSWQLLTDQVMDRMLSRFAQIQLASQVSDAQSAELSSDSVSVV